MTKSKNRIDTTFSFNNENEFEVVKSLKNRGGYNIAIIAQNRGEVSFNYEFQSKKVEIVKEELKKFIIANGFQNESFDAVINDVVVLTDMEVKF